MFMCSLNSQYKPQKRVHRFQQDTEEAMYHQRRKIKPPFSINKRRLCSDAAFPSFFFLTRNVNSLYPENNYKNVNNTFFPFSFFS